MEWFKLGVELLLGMALYAALLRVPGFRHSWRTRQYMIFIPLAVILLVAVELLWPVLLP